MIFFSGTPCRTGSTSCSAIKISVAVSGFAGVVAVRRSSTSRKASTSTPTTRGRRDLATTSFLSELVSGITYLMSPPHASESASAACTSATGAAFGGGGGGTAPPSSAGASSTLFIASTTSARTSTARSASDSEPFGGDRMISTSASDVGPTTRTSPSNDAFETTAGRSSGGRSAYA
eukprot:30550-Pelagococcus_subviridis.AAC.5